MKLPGLETNICDDSKLFGIILFGLESAIKKILLHPISQHPEPHKLCQGCCLVPTLNSSSEMNTRALYEKQIFLLLIFPGFCFPLFSTPLKSVSDLSTVLACHIFLSPGTEDGDKLFAIKVTNWNLPFAIFFPAQY